MAIARRVGDFQARLLLGLLYILFVLPVGLALRWSDDLLALRPNRRTGGFWQARPPHAAGLRHARRQG